MNSHSFSWVTNITQHLSKLQLLITFLLITKIHQNFSKILNIIYLSILKKFCWILIINRKVISNCIFDIWCVLFVTPFSLPTRLREQGHSWIPFAQIKISIRIPRFELFGERRLVTHQTYWIKRFLTVSEHILT